MNCESCQSTLIDLVYGELEEALANQAHLHIERCDACRLSFERLNEAVSLASHLPEVEPSAAVTERILEAAREKANLLPQTRPVREPERGSLWKTWIELVSHLAMGPQVAVAVVMLVVVAVGLWSVPYLRKKPDLTGGTVVDPDPAGEVGPSGDLAPAEPLDLAMDPYGRRIRSKEEMDELRSRNRAAAAGGGTGPSGQLLDRLSGADEDEIEALALQGVEIEAPPGKEQPLPGESRTGMDEKDTRAPVSPRRQAEDGLDLEAPPAALATSKAELREPAAEMQRYAARPMKKGGSGVAAGKSVDELFQGEAKAGPESRPQERFAPPPAPEPQTAAKMRAETRAEGGEDLGGESTRAVYLRGMSRYRAANYGGAIQDLGEVAGRADAGELRPTAMLYLARSYRASGRCALAVRHYEQLLKGFPRFGETSRARSEAAACYERMGQQARARELLERGSPGRVGAEEAGEPAGAER